MPACHWMLIRGCWRCIDGVSKNRVHVECNTRNGPYASIDELRDGVGTPLASSAPSRAAFVSPSDAVDAIIGGGPGGSDAPLIAGDPVPGGYGSLGAPGAFQGFGGGGRVYIRQSDGEIIEVDESEFLHAYVAPAPVLEGPLLPSRPIVDMIGTVPSIAIPDPAFPPGTVTVMEPASLAIYAVCLVALAVARFRRPGRSAIPHALPQGV